MTKLEQKKIENKITAILALTDVVHDENSEAIKQLILEIDSIYLEGCKEPGFYKKEAGKKGRRNQGNNPCF